MIDSQSHDMISHDKDQVGMSDSLRHLPQDVQSYLLALKDALVTALGAEQVVQIFVVGSASYPSGYIPGQSDLDVAVVTRSRLDQQSLQSIPETCGHAILPCPADKLELVVYAYDDVHLDSPRLPYNISLNFNTGRTLPHDHVRYGNNPDDSPHWFILDIAAAHVNNVPLLPEGPAFADMFTPALGRQQVLEALQTSLQWHIDNEATSANAVLNACRGLRWAEQGVFGSKLEGGKRFLAREPSGKGDQAKEAVRKAVNLREGAVSQDIIDVDDAEKLYALIGEQLQKALEEERRE